MAGVHRQSAEHCFDGGGAGFDVHALVAHRVAVQRRGLTRRDVRQPYIGIAEHQAPAGDRVGGLPLLTRKQLVQFQVAVQQRRIGAVSCAGGSHHGPP